MSVFAFLVACHCALSLILLFFFHSSAQLANNLTWLDLEALGTLRLGTFPNLRMHGMLGTQRCMNGTAISFQQTDVLRLSWKCMLRDYNMNHWKKVITGHWKMSVRYITCTTDRNRANKMEGCAKQGVRVHGPLWGPIHCVCRIIRPRNRSMLPVRQRRVQCSIFQAAAQPEFRLRSGRRTRRRYCRG